jgi:hypothetical protein
MMPDLLTPESQSIIASPFSFGAPPEMKAAVDVAPTMEDIRGDLDAIVRNYGEYITFTKLKREFVHAWERAYPKTMTKFQEYVKDNIKNVRELHPDAPHGQVMKIIGCMWKERPDKPRVTGLKRRTM